MYKSFRHVFIALIPYTLTIIAMRVVGYVDFRDVLNIYLPIFLLGCSPLVFGKPVIGYIFLGFACLGIVAGYLVYTANPMEAGLRPLIATFALLLLGIAAGASVEISLEARKKRSRRP